VLFANAFSPGDPLGAARLATAMTAITGPGLVTPPAEAAWWQLAGAIASMGAIYAAASGIAGHELMHRLNRARDLLLARVLLAFCLDTPLAIEHVYGHHRTVGTPADPTTAPRGMSFWRYLPRSVLGGNRNAWRFEAARLARSGRSRWSRRNRVLTGSALSLLVPAAFYAIGGWLALLAFLAAAANGKIYIEAFNYIGHYGLVRVPGTPAAARHSWNSYRIVTNGLMFNLPRHSSHHLRPADPYWRLQRQEAAPQVPFGMNLMALIALVPPLWHQIMNPLLADWDARFATGGELELVRQSGWRPRPVALS
jgi:alkane 1-monooxygenase